MTPASNAGCSPVSRLAEIRARLAGVTPGPWTVDDRGSSIEIVSQVELIAAIDTSYDVDFDRGACEENAALVAHAPADIEWLCDEVERLREALETISHPRWSAPGFARLTARRALHPDSGEEA